MFPVTVAKICPLFNPQLGCVGVSPKVGAASAKIVSLSLIVQPSTVTTKVSFPAPRPVWVSVVLPVAQA